MSLFALALTIGLAFSGEAHAGEAYDIQHRVDTAPEEVGLPINEPIYGILGLEGAMRNLGNTLDTVVMVHADTTDGIRAPIRSLIERRQRSWTRAFGNSRIRVRQLRVTDRTLLAIAVSEERMRAEDQQFCTSSVIVDDRDVSLHTYGDLTRERVSARQNFEQNDRTHLYFANDAEDDRMAVTHLAPGESITIVELQEDVKKQPKRHIRLNRKNKAMSITEGQGKQTVCLQAIPSDSKDEANQAE